MGKASDLINKISENFEVQLNTFTEKEIDEAFNAELNSLTESEINEEVLEVLEGFEDINEAKSTFPKAKQIKSMQALMKKNLAKIRAKKDALIKLANKYSNAKDRKAKLAITKERKAIQKEKDKLQAIQDRASAQKKKLEAERKAHNKANAKKKKSDKKAA